MADEETKASGQEPGPTDSNPQPAADQPPTGQSKTGVIKTLVNAVPAMRKDIDDNTLEIEKIKAQSEAQKSEKALTFSFWVFLIYLGLHVFFFYINRPLVLPDLLNQLTITMIVAPWIGHGIGRFVNAITAKIEEKKET